jgi:hypothetical protein
MVSLTVSQLLFYFGTLIMAKIGSKQKLAHFAASRWCQLAIESIEIRERWMFCLPVVIYRSIRKSFFPYGSRHNFVLNRMSYL